MNLRIWSVYERLTKVLVVIAGISLTVCIGLNFFEIVRRYMFSKSIYWIQDATLLCMMWFVFPGITRVVYDKQDILIDILVKHVPKTFKLVLEVIVNMLVCFFSALMSYEATCVMFININKSMSVSGIPTKYYVITMVFSFAIVALLYLTKTVDSFCALKGGKKK